MFPLIAILLISGAESAVFSRTIVDQFRTSREKHAFYQKLMPRITPVGHFHVTPYAFDRECLSVYRTNDWFFSQCTLPANCTNPSVVKLERTFFGQETVVCHSDTHHSSVTYEFYNMTFVPQSLALREPLRLYNKEFTVLKNLVPVSFFEWFFLVRSDDNRFGIVPRICDELFRNSTRLPKNVHVRREGNEFCFVEVSHDSYTCTPKLYPNVATLMMVHDFPVDFDDVPFSQGSYASTNNKAMGADQYLANNVASKVYVVDKVGGSYMVTYDPQDYSGPRFIVRSHGHVPTEKPFCFDLATHYASPIHSIFAHVTKFFHEALVYLLQFLKEIAADLALVLFKVISELFEILMSIVPYNSHFYTAGLVCLFTYFLLRDLLISSVVFFCVYSFKIYTDSLI
nr:hypothetical protein 2 [Ngewotan negevirus]AQM55323.1 hypothetical protein 2 [Ngewotan negevirus]